MSGGSPPGSAAQNTQTDPLGGTTAGTITDNSSSGVNSLQQPVSITSDTTTNYCFSVWFPKEVSATFYPSIGYRSGALNGDVILNTNTGVATNRTGFGVGSFGVIDEGTWWRLYAVVQNNNQSSINICCCPAIALSSTTAGGIDVSAEGTKTVYGFKMEKGTVPT
jgi:hypothetical protein